MGILSAEWLLKFAEKAKTELLKALEEVEQYEKLKFSSMPAKGRKCLNENKKKAN